MASVILNKAYPNLVKGSLLTTDASGNYVAANGAWFSPALVAAHPDIFLATSIASQTFFIANADGTTSTATGLPNATAIKANTFALLSSAQAAAAAAAALMDQYKV